MASPRRSPPTPPRARRRRCGEVPLVRARDQGDAAAVSVADCEFEEHAVEGGLYDRSGAGPGVGGCVFAAGGIMGAGDFEDDADEYLDYGHEC